MFYHPYSKKWNCFEYVQCTLDQPVTECQAYLTDECIVAGSELTLLNRNETSY